LRRDSCLHIALSGYYGCGNTGDEAVLAGIVESFRQRAGEGAAQITVLSADPQDTQRRHGLHAVDRMRIPVVRRTLAECDLLLSGGGSLLQDATSLRSLLYYLTIIWMARRQGKPVMFYAQGIGPLRRRLARALTRLTADRVHYITVRDPASAQLLKQIGVRKPPIEVTADPAFALQPQEPQALTAYLKRAGELCDRPLIGFALRPWMPPEPTIEEYARMADLAARKTGRRPLLLPMQPPGDVALSRRIADRLSGAYILEAPLSPQEMLGAVSGLSGLVAMRLHALIFGAMGAIPMVALGYDPKVASLMEMLGETRRHLPLERFDAEAVSDMLAEAMSEGETWRSALRRRTHELVERALSNVDRALLIAGGQIGGADTGSLCSDEATP
jgi:polysaccharide pyruvyl transferase CsaB